jgi:hypothetical protein
MFYVLDENHNLIEAYDKEGVLAVLAQAIADGSLSGISEDAGFVSKIKCCVTGGTTKVAFVTQAKYNELKATDSIDNTCLYFITDDTTAEDIDAVINNVLGDGGVQHAQHAEHAEHASVADYADTADTDGHGIVIYDNYLRKSDARATAGSYQLLEYMTTTVGETHFNVAPEFFKAGCFYWVDCEKNGEVVGGAMFRHVDNNMFTLTIDDILIKIRYQTHDQKLAYSVYQTTADGVVQKYPSNLKIRVHRVEVWNW